MKRIFRISSVIILVLLMESCKEKPTLPVISTTEVTDISNTSAISGGEVTNEGVDPLISRGICWNTSADPTISNSKTTETGGLGTFTSNITSLTPNTTYYVRAYGTNIAGTGYGNELIFKTYTGTVTDIELNSYNTVTIGTQVWMAENLKTTKYNDGTALPNITDNYAWGALTTGAYCDFSNSPSNSITYGRLYNWYTVDNTATKVMSNGSKNICPTSWHVPTDAEWTTLTTYLGGESVAGGKLKETGTTHWTSPNTGASNETSYTALPGGYRVFTFRTNSGLYGGKGAIGYWWSSTEYSTVSSCYRTMRYGYADVNSVNGSNSKRDGFSVRCLRDY
jgi:uncharacterized protein (TIGR02145 family)